MNYTLAAGLSVHQTVSLIMLAKPLYVIIGQPTTKSMNKMTEQMAQMVAPVKLTAWGGQHGSLALVLDNTDYKSITKLTMQTTALVTQPDAINQGIPDQSTQLKNPHPSSRIKDTPKRI
jgi:preprotein translocase subunit YajC